MEDLTRFYDIMEPVRDPPPHRPDLIEDCGRLWDPDTGEGHGQVFVPGFVQHTRRGYSRYSRRARFMCYMMDVFEIGEQQLRISTQSSRIGKQLVSQ